MNIKQSYNEKPPLTRFGSEQLITEKRRTLHKIFEPLQNRDSFLLWGKKMKKKILGNQNVKAPKIRKENKRQFFSPKKKRFLMIIFVTFHTEPCTFIPCQSLWQKNFHLILLMFELGKRTVDIVAIFYSLQKVSIRIKEQKLRNGEVTYFCSHLCTAFEKFISFCDKSEWRNYIFDNRFCHFSYQVVYIYSTSNSIIKEFSSNHTHVWTALPLEKEPSFLLPFFIYLRKFWFTPRGNSSQKW